MTARFFIAALGCQRLKPSPRPLPCSRANCARYVRYIVLGTIGYLKKLYISLLARLVFFGAFRRAPSSPKCAKKMSVNLWHSWGTAGATQ
jgi:hypothetical protein